VNHDSPVSRVDTQQEENSFTPSLNLAKFQEILSSARPAEIELMCDLVLLNSFTIGEAEEVTDYPDVANMLNSLLERKLVTLISEMPKVYQITGLISDELRAKLAQDTERFQSIARKSANVVKEKSPLQALELFNLSGDSQSALSIAVTNLQHLIYQADLDLLTKWAPKISQAINGGSLGSKMIKAYGLYAVGKFDQLRATLREIENSKTDGPLGRITSYESQILRMRLDFIYGNFVEVISKSDAILPSPSWEKNRTIDINFSASRTALITHFYLHNTDAFLSCYNKIGELPTIEAPDITLIWIHSFKAMRAFLTGQYLDAYEYALAACNKANEFGVEGSYFPHESAFILMDTSLEFGDDEKSQSYVDTYLPRALKSHQYPWIAAFYAKAALIQLQKGEINGALNLIRKGREAIDSPLFGGGISYVLDGHELIIRLAIGDTERLRELLYRLPDNSQVQTLKLALEISRHPKEATRLLKMMPDKTPVENFRKELILASLKASDRNQAMNHLERAIEIAIPNGYFRAFLNTSPQLKSYLLEYAQKKPTRYLENLAQAIRAQARLSRRDLISSNGSLTKRELEILRRLGSEAPILEIAQTLHISKNTIKTHLKNLYRKMDVESRDQAVKKARELGLL
jgi:ATP/maltotriose-dependent transcriptional regulator MalT